MKKKKTLVAIGIALGIVAILVFVDISAVISKLSYFTIVKNNLDWLASLLDKYALLLLSILFVVAFVWAKIHLSISITSCSIGGIEINLKNIEGEVRINVRNYLNTKRSLFAVYPEYDNFYDVFTSYHEVYEFLRTQIILFSSNRHDSETYIALQDMLKALNLILTKYQSDYRRWYEKENDNSFVFLSELQNSYPKYCEIVSAFKEFNDRMKIHAVTFDIDTFLSDNLFQ